jgi:glycosyltransferase involved in cell wall biosynthesis
MRILHTVEFYPPCTGGAQEVVRQISERLARRGHEVTVATSTSPDRNAGAIDGVRIVEFAVSGNAVRGFRGEVGRYQDFLRDGSFDVVLNYAAQQWATDLAFPILEQIAAAKVLVPCGFSGLYEPRYARYFAAMPDALRRYNLLVFHANSYRDADFARQQGIAHVRVIPNGAAHDEFAPVDATFRDRYGIAADAPLFLTVGNHTGVKGHAEVLAAFRQLCVDKAVLLIIGSRSGRDGCSGACRRTAWLRNLFSRDGKRILLLDPPRPDVVAAFHAADLFLFASNVEYSPLVLFEAMASRTPFLSAPCGNAEEIVAWGGGGVILPATRRRDGTVHVAAETLARAAEQLFHDADRRRALAAQGHAAWLGRFTWEKLARDYEAAYASLLG